MRSATEDFDKKLGIRLSERQRLRLEQLAQETESTPSDVVRSLIDTARTQSIVRRTVLAGNIQPATEVA